MYLLRGDLCAGLLDYDVVTNE